MASLRDALAESLFGEAWMILDDIGLLIATASHTLIIEKGSDRPYVARVEVRELFDDWQPVDVKRYAKPVKRELKP